MRLKKWVEPYTIGGVDYSLFYTEVDHNFKVGDRAFIEGGVYDSDNFKSCVSHLKESLTYKELILIIIASCFLGGGFFVVAIVIPIGAFIENLFKNLDKKIFKGKE